MREVHVDQIRDSVSRLCQDAATQLPEDVLDSLKQARESEESPLGVIVLDQILEHAELAGEERLPLCQETGTTVTTLTLTHGAMVVEFYHEGKHHTVTTPVVKNYRVEELNTAVLRAIRSKL